METQKIAILGLGVVGGGVYDILTQNSAFIQGSQGLNISVARILDRSTESLLRRGIDCSLFTADINEIVNDKSIVAVVETIGGVSPAKEYIEKLLRAGKHVISANKELISKHWGELESAAKQGSAGLYFEASCGGGIPIIRALTESLQGDNITDIYGIINGTTNYILSMMAERGLSYETALKQAQDLGYAEANPSSDVDGYDAQYKLSILSSLAFQTPIPYGQIYREGITRITAADIAAAKELGYVIKLLAVGRRRGNDVEARVHPALVSAAHPLASVNGAFNAVYLKGRFVDELMFYGRGAGSHPTASAIVSDIVKALTSRPRYCSFDNRGIMEQGITLCGNFTSRHYIAITAQDRPGVLSHISSVMGNNGISIESAIQRMIVGDKAKVIFLTHESTEQAILKAVGQIGALGSVDSIDNMIRVL